MVIKAFPPHEQADENGLLAVGGDLEVESLLLAYQNGIFPWPVYEDVLTWFSPHQRAILRVEDYKISKSFKKFLNTTSLTVVENRNFKEVIKRCKISPNRGEGQGTWITEQIVNGYIALHKAGYAHSIEAYDGDKLVGGLYGVSIGGMFAGESMFYDLPNASKLCLHYLLNKVRLSSGTFIDCQVLSPFTESLGAIEIDRESFLKLLDRELARDGF